MSILERHADKWAPEPNTGCYLWYGAVAGKANDRPQIRVGGKMDLISRLVCEEIYGPRPSDKHCALHNTRNGCVGGHCVNGGHLRWGTQAENMRDIPEKIRSERIRQGHLNQTKEQKDSRFRGLYAWHRRSEYKSI